MIMKEGVYNEREGYGVRVESCRTCEDVCMYKCTKKVVVVVNPVDVLMIKSINIAIIANQKKKKSWQNEKSIK